MHWFWKILVVLALVLAIPSLIWVIRESIARSKAEDEKAKA